ncbi:MAG: phosphoribosyltransferase [Chloroflexi bacterium]|nr:phosphoribosyltransferase [Chloroflexota bacterium]MCL5075024.1 phosphoribosyltransferase [Chloroflexota bacterium]
MLFADRHEAGQRLSQELQEYQGMDAIILALPRGGVVVGHEVAKSLGLPLDVFITRKIGAPGNPEYAIGAIAENGEVQLNEEEITAYGIPHQYIELEIERQKEEIAQRIALYRGGRPPPNPRDKTVILVDDGIATGFTMLTTIRAIKAAGAERLVLAIPVAPPVVVSELEQQVDRIVCLATPEPFWAVGRFYLNFEQISDDEVKRYLSDQG